MQSLPVADTQLQLVETFVHLQNFVSCTFISRNFRKGGKCIVVPAVGGHCRCAVRSLEGGVCITARGQMPPPPKRNPAFIPVSHSGRCTSREKRVTAAHTSPGSSPSVSPLLLCRCQGSELVRLWSCSSGHCVRLSL